MTRLVIHIERLVLRGFPEAARADVAAGLHAGLTRALSEPGAADRVARISHVARLRVKSVQSDRDSASHSETITPHAIGVGVARGIGRVLGR